MPTPDTLITEEGGGIVDQSGPDNVVFGSAAASVCDRGLAQYTLNMRAALLSGPDVMHDTSQARRIHAFALVKSDTCLGTDQRTVTTSYRPGTYENAELEGVIAERRLVVYQRLFLQHSQCQLYLRAVCC